MNKKLLLNTVKWVVSLSLMVWLYLNVDWNTFSDLVRSANPIYLLIGMGLTLLNTFFCAYKWKLFLKADGLDQKLGYLFVSYWIGNFVSLFLPSNIGGDAYRVVDVRNKTNEGVRTFTSVFADRLTGFLALTTIGLIASVIGFRITQKIEISLVVFGFLSLLIVLLLFICDPRWLKIVFQITKLGKVGAITKAHHSFSDTIRKYGRQPTLVFQTMLLSFAFHFTYISIVFIYSQFLGMDTPYYFFIIFIPVIAIFEALPISIYGIGVRDSAYVYFFAFASVVPEYALALSLVFVVTNVFYASVGGILLLLRRPSSNN